MEYEDALEHAATKAITQVDNQDTMPADAGTDLDLTVEFATEHFFEAIDDDDEYDSGELDQLEFDLKQEIKSQL